MNITDITDIPADTNSDASRQLGRIRKGFRKTLIGSTCGFMALGAFGSCQSADRNQTTACKSYNPPYGTLFGYDYHYDSTLEIGVWNFPNGKRMGYAQQEDSLIYRSAGCAKRSTAYGA